jgi:hypothetical protein
MADKLGNLFLSAAMGPLNYAGQCIMQSRVPNGLAELAVDSLMGAFRRGVQTVAKAAGLPQSTVEGLLPMAEIDVVAQRIAQNQRVAVDQWQVHAGHIGGLLDGIADLTVDNRPPDVSLCLLRLSKKMQLDKMLAAPLRQLSEDLVTWRELLTSCRTFIDDGRALESAYRQRRIVRLGMLMAGTLAVAVVVVWQLRLRAARGRVDAALAAATADPCAAPKIEAADLAKATDDQRERAGGLLKTCEEGRAAAAAAAEAEQKKKEAEERAQRTVKERLERCDALAAELGSGSAAAADKLPEAEPVKPVLARIAKGEIELDDVSELKSFPCLDTAAATRLAELYTRAVLGNSGLWITKVAPSKTSEELLVKGKKAASPKQMQILERHVEDLAKRAVRKGEADVLARVEVLCRLKERMDIPVRQQCQAARAVIKAQP